MFNILGIIDFAETVETWKQIFTEPFDIGFNCLNMTKCNTVYFTACAGTVTKECKRFKISSIAVTQFKCSIFACGLKSDGNAEVRTRILSKIEQNLDITQQVWFGLLGFMAY